MSINLSTLFNTDLAHLGDLLYDVNTYAGTTLQNDFDTVIGDYNSVTDAALLSGVESQLTSAQSATLGAAGFVQQFVQALVVSRVYQDTGLFNSSADALTELRRQFVVAGQSLKSYTVSATVANHLTDGNGWLYASTTDSQGLSVQNAFVEIQRVTCTADETTNSNFAGQEQFQVLGEIADANPLDQNWPLGSGANTTIAAIDSLVDAGTNLLTNSDFQSFTSNAPDSWTIDAGVAGTNFVSSSTHAYDGTTSLKLIGGVVNTAIEQAVSLSETTVYAFNLLYWLDVAPAAGVLRVSLVDENETVLTDNQGNSLEVNLTLSGATTGSWQQLHGFFATPSLMPTSVAFKISLPTAMSAGSNLWLAHGAFGAASQSYVGGPYLSLFSGNANFRLGDYYTVTVANSRPLTNKSFQVLLDRIWNLRASGQEPFPYASSPTINDYT